jgi:hypothetical protein
MVRAHVVSSVVALGLLLGACDQDTPPPAPQESEASLDPLAAASLGGEYLARMTAQNGTFVYAYDATTGRPQPGSNLVRHAGTVYAMLDLYNATGAPGLLAAADRALAHLETRVAPCPKPYAGWCLAEDNVVKLGTNALAILAFAEHREAGGPVTDVTMATNLARFLVSTQSADGEFTAHRISADTGAVVGAVSPYFPGEAAFALARLGVVTGDHTWTDAAHRGVMWLLTHRDADVPTAELPHDHWLLYALDLVHADRPEPAYAAQTRRLLDAIEAAQHQGISGGRRTWNGGFYHPPRSTPTATRSEGLAAAWRLLSRAGDDAAADRAFAALSRSIAFQLRTQVTPASAADLELAPDSIGGFYEALGTYTIRVDYVQHNISALLAYSEILAARQRGPSVTPASPASAPD